MKKGIPVSNNMYDRDAVVLVHGIWMTGWEMWLLGKRLRKQGFVTYRFHYASLFDEPEASSHKLASFVNKLPHQRIHLLGHSLGLRVIAAMLANTQPIPASIVHILALGSPLGGSQVARHLSSSKVGACLLGRAQPLLLKALPNWPEGYPPLGVIAGDFGFGMGRLFCRLPAPHDGAVSVSETQLEGMTAHITLHVSHFSMLFSQQVAAQTVAFLRNGNFTAPIMPHCTED